MLRDCLARNLCAFREACDGERTARAQSRDNAEAGVVPEGGEHRRGMAWWDPAGTRPLGCKSCHQTLAGVPTYFSMSLACPAQPSSFAAKALARRARGTWSNPDSVIVSLVPPATSSKRNSTSVEGSLA